MTQEQKCTSCDDTRCEGKAQRPGEKDEEFLERQALTSRMCRIKHKLIILSGKGGVGKSTVAANLAAALVMAGKKVGLLDIDVHGPSIPKLLHVDGARVQATPTGLRPVDAADGLKVMSVGLFLGGQDQAVIWRGPMKHSVIKQLLKDVDWGDLDYLVVDSPPGTGDEPLTVIQLIEKADGAIIVTTPQEVAIQDVRRSIMFCRRLALPVLGVVENMSGFKCPECGTHTAIFGVGGGETMARELEVPFLGVIPIDPKVVLSGDGGEPIVQADPHAETSRAFARIVRPLLQRDLAEQKTYPTKRQEGRSMKVAIPVVNGMLSTHFGHSEQFALFDVDTDAKTIVNRRTLTPPPHEPGVLPRWLHEQQANVIITGGMGSRAQSLFAQNGIQVVVGAASADPERVVLDYLEGSLQTGDNVCDH